MDEGNLSLCFSQILSIKRLREDSNILLPQYRDECKEGSPEVKRRSKPGNEGVGVAVKGYDSQMTKEVGLNMPHL